MKEVLRSCKVTGQPFTVSAEQQDFLQRLSQTFPHVQLQLPFPEIHPLEQVRRMFAYTNYLTLYHERSALSGKPQISRYPSQLGTRVCTIDEFYSDAVDNIQFGREYDFSRSFFEQWIDLLHACYLIPLNNFNAEGSQYVNGVRNVKDCYLCFNARESVDCMYSMLISDSSDCVSCHATYHSQYCYECIDVEHCYECQDCRDCRNSSFCFGSLDLIGCQYCFGCAGLRNQQYCIFNQTVEPEQYKAFIAQQRLGSITARNKALEQCNSFIASLNHSVNRMINCEDSTGASLRNCKNVKESYFCSDCSDSGYLITSSGAKDCWTGFSLSAELTYLSMSVSGYFEVGAYACGDSQYMINCFNCLNRCAHCFGCVALKGKSYCILNRQYSKEEYFSLLPRIIAHMQHTGEWGNFFPAKYSPYMFRSTMAFELFERLNEDELKRRGYRLDEVEEPVSDASAPSTADRDNIQSIDLKQIAAENFLCAESGKPFRYQLKELEFHRRLNIALPQVAWRARVLSLMHRRDLIPAVERVA